MSESTAKLDVAALQRWKAAGERFVALTAYDYPTARLVDEAGVDVVFVGDSVGTNVLGYESEREVTLDDVRHHLRAVRRGTKRALILADLPYRTYETVAEARENAGSLVRDGADLVKLEGGCEQVDKVRALVEDGVVVCGHIGFTPQTLFVPGQKGRVQGRLRAEAEALLADARALEAAGVAAIVLELVPEALGGLITRTLSVPTIGIGAGRGCDGQVLIVHDVLGLSVRTLRLAKAYTNGRDAALDAVRTYAAEVRDGAFPAEANGFAMDPAELPGV